MYCKTCGNQIEEGTAFCPSCGTKASNAPSVGNPEASQGRTGKRINCDSLAKGNLITNSIFGIFFVTIGAYYLNNLSYYNYDVEKAMGILFIVLGIFSIISAVVKYLIYKERFLSINEHGITGVGPGTHDFINKKFNILYKDIISVEKKKLTKVILIQTATSKNTIAIPQREVDRSIEIIKKLMQAHKNNQSR